MSVPKQKSRSNMLSDKVKSGPACINVENPAQATPIDSSRCSKSRIVLGRETIRDMEKNARQNLSLSSSQSPFVLSMANVYHCFAFPVKENGNNFHLSVLVSCLRCSGMNTSPRIRASDGMGFCFLAQRRVVPEPWLLDQGGVHGQMKRLVLKVTSKTHPLKQKDFEMELA